MRKGDLLFAIDFGGPRKARDPRRKIIAIVALATGRRRDRVDERDMKARLLTTGPSG